MTDIYLFAHSSGSWNSTIGFSQGFSPRVANGCPLAASTQRTHVRVLISFFYKDADQDEIGAHPYDLSLPLLPLSSPCLQTQLWFLRSPGYTEQSSSGKIRCLI